MVSRLFFVFFALCAFCVAGELEEFVEAAGEKHGEFGKRAAVFLVEGMPESDRVALTSEFLMENLDLAVRARGEFAWAKGVPEEVFFNDVLPYAALDETRESWRAFFYEKAAGFVKEAKTASEAAQALNKGMFQLVNVHYNRKRKAPNQSAFESIEIGKATCTGLSIILVDACRSVGVPARIVGTALWASKRGNHTWVEIYDEGEWHFMGADEYDKKGLNRGWFVKDAAKAIEGEWQHAIWATSWKKTEGFFPMVWDLKNREVAAVNVTARYVKKVEAKEGVVFVRVWDREGGERVVAILNGGVKTKAGTADLNDMAELVVKAGERVKVTFAGETREVSLPEGKTVDLYWDLLK